MVDKASILKEAQRYLSKGQIDKAIAEWEKLSKENPDGNTYNTIGDLYLKKGDKKSAIDSFHNAATFFWREGFSSKALALYKKILNIDPANGDALFSIGSLNEEKGLTADALKFYLAAAESISREGKKEKLLDIYNKILSISPNNITLRDEMAELYAREGLVLDAAKEYLYIAKHHDQKGNSEESVKYYQKVIDIQPLNKEAILGLNYLYEKIEKLENAIEQMKEAFTLFPQDTDVHFRGAELYIKSERLDEARGCLRKVTEIEPDNLKARELLGEIYIREGDKKKAWMEYLPVIDRMILDKHYNDAMNLIESFKDIDVLETGKRLISIHRQLGNKIQVANGLVSLGDFHATVGMLKEALNYYKEALLMNPNDDSIRAKVMELQKGEKTVDEVLEDADIFLSYGLYDEAKEVLEKLKGQEPENIEIHEKLKFLYVNTNDKEMAVTECLILAQLYNRAGNIEQREKTLNEAYKIDPEDPRLFGRTTIQPPEEVITPYSEVQAPMEDVGRKELTEMKPTEESLEKRREAEEFAMPGAEVSERVEAPGPAPDSEVLSMFDRFKEKIEKELTEEDSETHYNLGIAYKEMGLIDDAIKEFQISRNNPKMFFQSSSMLGVCYIEKGLYPPAIDILSRALKEMKDQDESYWAMKYDLAEAYEKNGNFKEALDLYFEVHDWDSKFRGVSDKINQFKAMTTKSTEEEKPRGRKDRISYI